MSRLTSSGVELIWPNADASQSDLWGVVSALAAFVPSLMLFFWRDINRYRKWQQEGRSMKSFTLWADERAFV
jgi:hypothetical protein